MKRNLILLNFVSLFSLFCLFFSFGILICKCFCAYCDIKPSLLPHTHTNGPFEPRWEPSSPTDICCIWYTIPPHSTVTSLANPRHRLHQLGLAALLEIGFSDGRYFVPRRGQFNPLSAITHHRHCRDPNNCTQFPTLQLVSWTCPLSQEQLDTAMMKTGIQILRFCGKLN